MTDVIGFPFFIHLLCKKNYKPMEKHDLLHEFPQQQEKINELKAGNSHFKSLYEDYEQANNEIYDIETNVVNVSDEVLNNLRMKRVHLKDEIYNLLK